MSNQIEKYRQEIAKKIRQLRQERQWTQKELAKLLGLSQNRLSEIESGEGSFTAEQLLLLSKNFNVPVSDFVSAKGHADQKIQNTLARLGAHHLLENQAALPSEKLEPVANLLYETLLVANSSRQITSLAPVIVNFATPSVLNQLWNHFDEKHLLNRLGWILNNTSLAINLEREKSLTKEWEIKYEKAYWLIQHFFKQPFFKGKSKKSKSEDILDNDIRSKESLDRVRKASSQISKIWDIVTRIQPEDFAQALKDARETR